MGVVLAVNGETAEERNASSDCAPNRPEKRGFTTLSSVLLYTFTFVMVSCLCLLFVWNSSDPKMQIYFLYLL